MTFKAHPATGSGPLAAAPGSQAPFPWLCLVAGTACLLVAGGLHATPAAAWLAPLFLLRFLRNRRPMSGLGVLLALFVPALWFQWHGALPWHGWLAGLGLVLAALIAIVPYLVDRILAVRLRGIASTFVFPSALVVTEYFLSRGPTGTWGSVAYTQCDNLALCQLVSLTGLWGLTFLVGWFASVGNLVWAQGWGSRTTRLGVLLCAGSLALTMALGGLRLAWRAPSSPKVKVASLSRTFPKPHAGPVARGAATPEELAAFRQECKVLDDDLLSRSEREAQAGARIVFWGETNGQALKVDEPELIERGRDLARRNGIYLGMGLGIWNPGRRRPLDNKFVLVTPEGEVAWDYAKAHPVPGGEASVSDPGEGRLPSLDTPYGRLSSIICFDADFPQLLAQAGPLGIGLMLDPSNDWRAIDPLHTRMASFRALEQGFNLVRHASLGQSAAFDYHGRRLAVMDHFHTQSYTMVSEVPTLGVRTLYSRLGDWLAWVCAAALLFLAINAKARPPISIQLG